MLTTRNTSVMAPGARVQIRNAEWLVRKVDRTSSGGEALTVIGISEIVRDREAIFLTELEPSIEVLDPAETTLVPDPSSGFIATRLYVESLLRQTPPTDDRLYIGHRAAMDPVPYQLDPAAQALRQPRQRILIADAVGLGKTLEAGILLAELIHRGHGKRILVVTTKSMLAQFQKEMWSRFTIPLVRLDSVGIQRVRTKIPTNHNPFYHYDRSIISIDTLKNDAEYRTWLEKAWWDVIVIDEAHNVAERGTSSSLRSKLAQLLARRSDTLVLLSATPHDGKARSFASLMNMLDATAIADPDNYTKDDIKGLFIRRFKKDVKDQVEAAFREPEKSVEPCAATPVEEAAFDFLADLRFTRLDRRQGSEMLFKTTLEKALFSSPRAAVASIDARLGRLRAAADPAFAEDVQALQRLRDLAAEITPERFSRYQGLLRLVRERMRWTARDTRDRLVIFTERVETLKFLSERLPADLGLTPEQVATLCGTDADTEQQSVVEDFGRDHSRVRLLIATDVASEGINLHFLCHRMVHFDIPWSLMVFQQRNGRIDRYGQERTPRIAYLKTLSRNEKIRGDVRILELLIEKDAEAAKNIGDPSAFMGVYDATKEEEITAQAIQSGETPEQFETRLQHGFDPLALLLGAVPTPTGQASALTADTPSLFASDFEFARTALSWLKSTEKIQAQIYEGERRIDLTAPKDLRARFKALPAEVVPEDHQLTLSADPRVIQAEIAECRRRVIKAENDEGRKTESAWPRIHFLWPLHPAVEWLNDKVTAAFKRHHAPVVTLRGALPEHETAFLMSGVIPNRKGHPLVHDWFAAVFAGDAFLRVEPLPDLLARTGFASRSWPNPGGDLQGADALQALLPEAVGRARAWMRDQRATFETAMRPRLEAHVADLKRLRGRHVEQLELFLSSSSEDRRAKEQRRVNEIFDEYQTWIQETMTGEDQPYVQVAAVFRGAR